MSEQILLGERLSTARQIKGLTLKQLAHQMGVKKVTLDKWESGESTPRANRLNQLAGVLDVPLLWLLGGADTPPSSNGFDTNETTGIEARLQRAEQLVNELSLALADIRVLTKRVQQKIDEN